MAQHDQVIDNGSGLSVRTDINAALAALFSNSSGPIEPTTTVAGQMWFDTADVNNARLWQRNASNSAWVRIYDVSNVDMGFGRRTSPDRFVWNDKADMSGTDVMTLDDTGALATTGAITANGYKVTGVDMSFGMRKAGTPAGTVDRFVVNNAADFSGGDVLEMRDNGALLTSGSIFANNIFGTRDGWATGGGALFSTMTAGENLAGPFIAMRGNGYSVTAERGAMELATSGGTTLKLPANRAALFYSTCAFMSDPSFILTGNANSYFLQYDPNHQMIFQRASGDLLWYRMGTTAFQWRQSDGAIIQWSGTAYKPGGGPWGDSSDARIKNVIGNYEHGLDEILTLQPIRYTFKGNDTGQLPPLIEQHTDEESAAEAEAESGEAPYKNSPHYQAAIDGTEFIGLIAQDTETVFPEMVAQVAGTIDGVEVTDLRNLDTTPLVYALVNAVKTLTARIEALEAA